ncbi:MAG: ABC transporter substrate-binding protein [Desulfatiglans sp.]|jgi:ABC-type branched-subunit amino acid transport system substrate-binding protein|nr:ABC transporter substrate-binding protein [Thermodesulfobacteriota bacterium]MEE4351385.1 ABC transporter substrate-binding protein [Desulfatiglans sp.]
MGKRLFGVFMLLCFLAVLPISVHAKEDVSYRIIGMYDLTGPYSGLHQVILRGIKDFVAWANEEPGYFPDGVKWDHEIYDTGMDMQKCVAAYQMATSKKPEPIITTGGLASPTIIAIKPLAKRKKIPCIDGSSARPIVHPAAWSFSMQGCYEGMIAASAKFLKDNWNANTPYKLIRKRYEENKGRNPRLGLIGWDNAFGRAFDQKEIKPYLKQLGVDWVEPEYVPVSPTDTTPQILRLVKRGADMIYFGMYPNTHATILKDAARVGVRDKFQDMAFWADNIIQIRTYAGEIANETMMLTGYQPDTNEWEPAFKKMFEKTKMSEDYALGYSLAMSWFDVYGESIRRAVKKVGPEKVTGRVIYDVLTSMTDYKCMAYNSLITFKKNKTFGPSTASIYQNQNGKIVKIVDSIYTPNLLPGGEDVVK